MSLFSILIIKLIPLYVLIVIGFVAGKKFSIDRKSLAPLLVYVITPIMIFLNIVTAKIQWNLIFLPLIFLLICSLISTVVLVVNQKTKFLESPLSNILAFATGSGNTGYFGIPVGIALFGEKVLPVFIIAGFGFILFENSLGFFYTARGTHSKLESFWKLAKLPSIYSFLAALTFNYIGAQPSPLITDLATQFRGAYSILGMMFIGIALAGMIQFKLNKKFVATAFTVKFLIWPLLVSFIIILDKAYLHVYGTQVYQIMLLLSLMPLPANSVAIATELDAAPDATALTVVLSTFVGVVYIPLMCYCLGILNPI